MSHYPDANGLTLIAETRATTGVDSFRFRVPNEFTLYNTSWEYYSYDSFGQDGNGVKSLFKLDGNELIGTDGSFNHNSSSNGYVDERYFGTVNTLSRDVLHKGDLWYMSFYDTGSSNIAIVLIYKQP